MPPQKYCPSAIIKSSHYYGTEISRPIPDYKLIEGDLFQQVDSAIDYVMFKLSRNVGGRDRGVNAEVNVEIPNEVIAELMYPSGELHL